MEDDKYYRLVLKNKSSTKEGTTVGGYSSGDENEFKLIKADLYSEKRGQLEYLLRTKLAEEEVETNEKDWEAKWQPEDYANLANILQINGECKISKVVDLLSSKPISS